MTAKKAPGLWTAIGIGVGTMIGSGWLFSAYYAAQYMGPVSLVSWGLGAIMSLVLALLLAEIAGMFKSQALFSRLITISHENADFGFVIAISGWLCLVLVTPTEASATIQYLSTLFPSANKYLFINQQHTLIGSISIIVLVLLYSALNFWGIHTFAKVSNTLAVFKIVIPVLTALILISASFHPSNFVSQGFASYGEGRVFSGVIVCGIFYAFYGFSLVAMYGAELEDPKKNIPRALIISVFICFLIYSLLQVAFIGGVPPAMIANGWSQLDFTSPLAQLLILLDMHVLMLWTMVLYFDATVSPSGSAMICLSSATRTVTGMAKDNQFPQVFDKIHPVYNISRPSLIFTTVICCFILLFFKNWKELMILVSVFQLTSCIAIPIAFVKLRHSRSELERIYQVKWGKILSYAVFMLLTLFLVQVDVSTLMMSLALYIAFFILYLVNYYRANFKKMLYACYSAGSIFVYLALAVVFGYLNQLDLLKSSIVFSIFFVVMSLSFWLLIHQKNYGK